MTDLARTLERQLWDLFADYDAAYAQAAEQVGLSAPQACVLVALADGDRTMGDLATVLQCDASNVTQLVGRLESRELVVRTPDLADRRARRVAITPAGRRQHRAVLKAFTHPGERIGRLTETEQRRLTQLLGKLRD